MHTPLRRFLVETEFANEDFVVGQHVPHMISFGGCFVDWIWMKFHVIVIEIYVNGYLAEVSIESAEWHWTLVDSFSARGFVGSNCLAAERSAAVVPPEVEQNVGKVAAASQLTCS